MLVVVRVPYFRRCPGYGQNEEKFQRVDVDGDVDGDVEREVDVDAYLCSRSGGAGCIRCDKRLKRRLGKKYHVH